MAAPLLNIAALSRRTGVAPDTLRKWEQRYGVLRPDRTARRPASLHRDRRRSGSNGSATGSAPAGASARRPACSTRPAAAALDDPADLRDALIASIRDSEPHALLGDARPGVRRAPARAGADGRRHTRAALGRRGMAPRRAVDRAGARDHGQGAGPPRQADLGRAGWRRTESPCSRAPRASSTTSAC